MIWFTWKGTSLRNSRASLIVFKCLSVGPGCWKSAPVDKTGKREGEGTFKTSLFVLSHEHCWPMKSEDIFHRGCLTTEPMKDWEPINTSGITVLLVKTCFDLFQNSGKLHFATKTTFLIRQKRKEVGSISSRWSGK